MTKKSVFILQICRTQFSMSIVMKMSPIAKLEKEKLNKHKKYLKFNPSTRIILIKHIITCTIFTPLVFLISI